MLKNIVNIRVFKVSHSFVPSCIFSEAFFARKRLPARPAKRCRLCRRFRAPTGRLRVGMSRPITAPLAAQSRAAPYPRPTGSGTAYPLDCLSLWVSHGCADGTRGQAPSPSDIHCTPQAVPLLSRSWSFPWAGPPAPPLPPWASGTRSECCKLHLRSGSGVKSNER